MSAPIGTKVENLMPEFATALLEGPTCPTDSERLTLSDSVVKVHGDEVTDADEWRVSVRALNNQASTEALISRI